jgi:hypothetical protein
MKFKFHKFIGGIPVPMILDQKFKCFVVSPLTNEPSGRFRDKVENKELDTRHQALQSGREDPLHISCQGRESSIGCLSRDDSPQIPDGIIDRCHSSAMSRVCDLCDKQWACGVADVSSETDEESSRETHCFWMRGRRPALKECADDDYHATDTSAPFSADAVCDVWVENEDSKASEAGNCTEYSES